MCLSVTATAIRKLASVGFVPLKKQVRFDLDSNAVVEFPIDGGEIVPWEWSMMQDLIEDEDGDDDDACAEREYHCDDPNRLGVIVAVQIACASLLDLTALQLGLSG